MSLGASKSIPLTRESPPASIYKAADGGPPVINSPPNAVMPKRPDPFGDLLKGLKEGRGADTAGASAAAMLPSFGNASQEDAAQNLHAALLKADSRSSVGGGLLDPTTQEKLRQILQQLKAGRPQEPSQ